MKIAFIGAHGVGKTTLCYDLAARIKRLDFSVEIVREVARACPLPLNRDTTLDAQRWILHRQIADEIAAVAEAEIVLCDRSVLDNYAYLAAGPGPREELEPLVAEWLRSYDHLFKVPVLAPPRFDGTRDLSEAFQNRIDAQIEALLVRFGAKCDRLDGAGRARWPELILSRMGLPDRRWQIDLFGERD